MIRVLFDARKARDFGIGRYILGLIRALCRRNDVEPLAVARTADRELFPEAVEVATCEAHHYSLEELLAVRRIIGRIGPDLFHAPHYVIPFFPPRATVVTIHDLMHLTRPEHDTAPKRLYARVMLRRAVRGAARIVAVSEATRADLVSFDPRSAAKMVVIPNGVEERFVNPVPAADLRGLREGLTVQTPYLLFLGNDKPHKNLPGLLDAFALFLRRRRDGPQLVLAGGDPGRLSRREQEAEVRGIAANVKDLGIVPDDDVPALVAGAALLILPSFAEGFGLPVLEAQAAGVPVVCSDIPALRETAGEAAVFVDPAAPSSIAEGIETVLGNETVRTSLREKGRARARQFTWDKAASRTVEIYRDVLGKVSKATPLDEAPGQREGPAVHSPFKEMRPDGGRTTGGDIEPETSAGDAERSS